MSEEHGRVQGALSLMYSPSFSTRVNYFIQPAAAFMAALTACSGLRSPKTMASFAHLFAVFLVRYQRPYGFNDAQVTSSAGLEILLPEAFLFVACKLFTSAEMLKILCWKMLHSACNIASILGPLLDKIALFGK